MPSQVRQELSAVDQSLAILQAAWKNDPGGFDLKSWQSRIPALTRVSDDIFIANDKRVIVQDILPQAVGQGVGAAYLSRGNGTLESIVGQYQSGNQPDLVLGAQAENGVVRQYFMYMIRPLGKPAGWLIGASYRSAALAKVFAEGSLGNHGVAALIDTRHGGVQAVAGPAALRPKLNVADTGMYRSMLGNKAEAGTWIGPTGMDGEVRIHAYRRIPGRDLLVLAGVDEADWMAPARAWARGVQALAAVGSALVAGIGVLVFWVLWKLDSNRRRRRALEQAAIQLNSAHSVLEAAQLAAQSGMAQVRAVMEASSDGIALFDAEWRLASWNAPFAAKCGLETDLLRGGLAVDELLRHQGQAGLLGKFRDVETEIARRLVALRTGIELAVFHQAAPDGRALTVRGCSMPDGAMMLVVTAAPTAERPRLDVAAGPTELEQDRREPQPVGSRAVEW